MNKIFLAFIALLLSFNLSAQTDNELVQFTGVVVTGDWLQAFPYSIVMIKNTSRGTFSDYYGFFSFVARKNDTIEFSCIGFQRAFFVIPDTLTDNRYSIVQMLNPDTVKLPTATVMPFPTKEEFARIFVEMSVPDDNMQRAARNLDPQTLAEIAEFEPQDPGITFKTAMQYQQTKLYTSGQYLSNQLLNPVAWASFIDAWKKGAFKKKK